MRRAVLLTVLFSLSLLLLPSEDRPAGAQAPPGVFIANLPEVLTIRGTVSVKEPIPHTRLLTIRAVVSPASFGDTPTYIEGGVLEADGFGRAAVGVAGQVRGRLSTGGPIGVLLLPDEPDILAAFEDDEVQQFPVRLQAQAAPSDSGLFSSPTAHIELAFPRYRVFFYNETSKTSDVTLYAYLKSS